MSNAFFNPFNHQPDSVSIKTSTYTVPAGKYARVTVVDVRDNFTIDSVVAVPEYQFIGPYSSTPPAFTNSSPYPLIGSLTCSGGTAFVVRNGGSAAVLKHPYTGNTMTVTSGSIEIFLNPGDQIYNVSSSTVDWHLMPISQPTDVVFWVPSGTDLNGQRYIVELYNEFS